MQCLMIGVLLFVGLLDCATSVSPLAALRWPLRSLLNTRLDKNIIFLPCTEPPISNAEFPEILLIAFPGSLKSPEDYKSFAEAIQKSTLSAGLRVHIGIGRFFGNFPFSLGEEEFSNNVAAVMKRAQEDQCSFQKTFVLGHSIGALGAMSCALPLDGVIQLGATMNSKGKLPWAQRSLASYPKPALTIVGTRDGFVRFLALGDELDDLDAQPAPGFTVEERGRRTPVIALPLLNHMHTGDGVVSKLTSRTGRKDMGSPLMLEDAWIQVAELVTAFMAVNIGSLEHQRHTSTSVDDSSYLERGALGKAVAELEVRVKDTRALLAPFRLGSSPATVGKFAAEAQGLFLNLRESHGMDQPRVVSHWHDTKLDFLYSEPHVQVGLGNTSTTAIQLIAQPPLKKNKMTSQLSPTVAIKMKSQAAVLDSVSGLVAVGPPPTAQELNTRTFAAVLGSLNDADRQRYLEYGQQLKFLPDLEVASAPAWVDAPLDITVDETSGTFPAVRIRSPVCSTPVDMQPEKFAGMFYCKLLTPMQAYEWMLYDAFK